MIQLFQLVHFIVFDQVSQVEQSQLKQVGPASLLSKENILAQCIRS